MFVIKKHEDINLIYIHIEYQHFIERRFQIDQKDANKNPYLNFVLCREINEKIFHFK
jgi:hypothetical protein